MSSAKSWLGLNVLTWDLAPLFDAVEWRVIRQERHWSETALKLQGQRIQNITEAWLKYHDTRKTN